MIRKSPGLCLATAIVAYFALWLLVPKATLLPALVNHIDAAMRHSHGMGAFFLALSAMLLMAAPTVAFMAIQIAIVYYFAKLKLSFAQSSLFLVLSLAAIAGIMAVIVWQSGVPAKVHRLLTLREALYITSIFHHWLKMPMYALLMLAAADVGYLVSLRIKDKNLLLPVVMFAAWIDFWTVTKGPVAAVIKNAPEVVGAVSAPIPTAGAGAFVPKTMVGPGDFLFMGLVFAAVHRLGMKGARNYWFVCVAMTLGMLAVVFNLVSALPALVVLAVAVVSANWREFKLTKQEIISIGVIAVLLGGSLPLIWSLFRQKPEPKKTHARPPIAGKPSKQPTAPREAK